MPKNAILYKESFEGKKQSGEATMADSIEHKDTHEGFSGKNGDNIAPNGKN